VHEVATVRDCSVFLWPEVAFHPVARKPRSTTGEPHGSSCSPATKQDCLGGRRTPRLPVGDRRVDRRRTAGRAGRPGAGAAANRCRRGNRPPGSVGVSSPTARSAVLWQLLGWSCSWWAPPPLPSTAPAATRLARPGSTSVGGGQNLVLVGAPEQMASEPRTYQ
jgi:hypothetical protein